MIQRDKLLRRIIFVSGLLAFIFAGYLFGNLIIKLDRLQEVIKYGYSK